MELMEELYRTADKQTNKGWILQHCLTQDLTFDEVSTLVHLNRQPSLGWGNVAKLMNIIARDKVQKPSFAASRTEKLKKG